MLIEKIEMAPTKPLSSSYLFLLAENKLNHRSRNCFAIVIKRIKAKKSEETRPLSRR